MKLSDLKLPEKNVRLHPTKQIHEFIRSIKMFGQTRPIVVDENNMILIGNGLYRAMTEMGMEEAAVLKRTDLSEAEKKKLMIADNKIYSLGVDDIETTNEFIKEILDYDVPGYDEDLLRMLMADAEEVNDQITEYGILEQEEISNIQSKSSSMPTEEAAYTPQTYVNTSAPQSLDTGKSEAPQTNVSVEPIPAAQGRYVICPKCGEKIWL